MKELTDLVEKIVTEKTFSLEAAKQVEALKTSFEKTAADRDKISDILDQRNKQLDEKSKEITKLQATLDAIGKERDALKAEQEQAKKAIYEAALHQSVALAYKDAMQIVFRPNSVRETIHRSTPVSVQPTVNTSGYVTNYNSTEEVTKEG